MGNAVGAKTVAVITGGGGGMGRATARRLGRDHVLLLTDSDADRVETTALELRALGMMAETLVGDVTDRAFVTALAAAAQRIGRLRVLLHTAGISPSMGTGDRKSTRLNSSHAL